MSHKILEFDRKQTGKFEAPDLDLDLDLEHYTGPVQVMSPEEMARGLPLVLSVCGNVLIGILLLGGLMLMPALLAGLVPPL